MTPNVFISQRLGGKQPQKPTGIQANLLIYKYFTSKSLFLKDLAKHQR
jgi:hypothetical protein